MDVITDSTFDGGRIALYLSTGSTGGGVVFDNLIVKRPTEAITQTEFINPLTASPTPAPFATPLIDPTPVPGSNCRFMHIFRPGDTSFRIELRYGTPFDKILEANGFGYLSAESVGKALCIP